MSMTEETEDGDIESALKWIPDLLAELGIHVSEGALAGEFAGALRYAVKTVKPTLLNAVNEVKGSTEKNNERLAQVIQHTMKERTL